MLNVRSKLLLGVNPPEDIIENSKFREAKLLMEIRFKIIKISNVNPEYKKKI